MHKQRLFILIAVGVGILGMLLPWASVKLGFLGSYSQNGFGSGWTGWGTLAALGAAAGILFKAPDRNTPIDADTKKVVLGGGAGATLLPIIFIIIIKASSYGSAYGLGIGVFLCILAGIGIMAIPFAIKADGEFEMPSKDSISKDIDEIKGGDNDSSDDKKED